MQNLIWASLCDPLCMGLIIDTERRGGTCEVLRCGDAPFSHHGAKLSASPGILTRNPWEQCSR